MVQRTDIRAKISAIRKDRNQAENKEPVSLGPYNQNE